MVSIRLLIFTVVCLAATPLRANLFELDQLSCDSLDRLVENIFEADLFEKQYIRQQVPELYRQMELKDCAGLPNAMNLLGIIHFNRMEPAAAKRFFLRVDSLLKISAPQSRAYIRSQLWLGLADLQENRRESANLYFDKSLRLSEQSDFKKGMLQAYINMGTASIAQGDLDRAEKVLRQALAINEEVRNRLWIGYAYLNLGRIYTSRGDYDKGLEYTRQSERLWQELQFPKGLYYSNLNFASINDKLNQVDERAYHLRKALEYAVRDSTINPHNTYVALGYHYYLNTEELEQAKSYFGMALKNSQTITDQQLIDVAAILLEIYTSDQDIEGIKKLNTDLLEIYRSRAELARIEAMKWQSKEIALEKQISENSSLREKQLANELKLQQRNLLLLFALALVAVFVLVAYLQFRAARQRRLLLEKIQSQNQELTRINEQLLAQKVRIEEQNKTILDTQDQLIVQEKMASLGQLTAGIAHEIKNPLNFIINFAEGSKEIAGELLDLLSEQAEERDPEKMQEVEDLARDLQENSSDIERNGRKVDRIVYSMLDHARSSKDNWQLIDLNELLDENANLAYHSYRANDQSFNVIFEKSYDPELPKIKALPLHLGRVILNILNNACYAVNQKQKTVDEQYQPTIWLKTGSTSDMVEVLIRDNGPGIPDDVVKNIFTPFFTTKPTGSGNTGLGLSISYDIVVKEHQGKLQVNTKAGNFTEFHILLPLKDRT